MFQLFLETFRYDSCTRDQYIKRSPLLNVSSSVEIKETIVWFYTGMCTYKEQNSFSTNIDERVTPLEDECFHPVNRVAVYRSRLLCHEVGVSQEIRDHLC